MMCDCGNPADYICNDCESPVCDKCASIAEMAYQGDHPGAVSETTRCPSCYNTEIALEYAYREQEWDKEDRLNKKRIAGNLQARARYWLPENIKKREKLKELKRVRDQEAKKKRMKELGAALKDFFTL